MFDTYIEPFSFASDIGSQKLELCIWTYFEIFGYRPDTEIGPLFVILLRLSMIQICRFLVMERTTI